MGFREKFGGLAEEALNKVVRDNLSEVSTDKIKKELHKQVDKLVDEHIGGKLDGLADKICANFIDKIDGQDDIPDI